MFSNLRKNHELSEMFQMVYNDRSTRVESSTDFHLHPENMLNYAGLRRPNTKNMPSHVRGRRLITSHPSQPQNDKFTIHPSKQQNSYTLRFYSVSVILYIILSSSPASFSCTDQWEWSMLRPRRRPPCSCLFLRCSRPSTSLATSSCSAAGAGSTGRTRPAA